MAFQEENCHFRLFRLSDYIMRKTKFGYIKDGNYICIGDNMHGIYKTYDDMRFNGSVRKLGCNFIKWI